MLSALAAFNDFKTAVGLTTHHDAGEDTRVRYG